MKKTLKKHRQKNPSHINKSVKRFLFKCIISAAALAVILFINSVAPSFTRPLADTLYKSTDFTALKNTVTQYINEIQN